MKFFDGLKFKAYLVKVNWDGFCFTSNPNDALAHFLKIVNKLDKHVPYKIKKKNKQKYCKVKKVHLSYLDPGNNNTIFLSLTQPEDTEDPIKSMKTKQVIQIVFQPQS